jgi:hypothetical protein
VGQCSVDCAKIHQDHHRDSLLRPLLTPLQYQVIFRPIWKYLKFIRSHYQDYLKFVLKPAMERIDLKNFFEISVELEPYV